MNQSKSIFLTLFAQLGKLILSIICIGFTALFLFFFVQTEHHPRTTNQTASGNYAVMDRYDKYMTNTVSEALDGVMSIKKEYWLSDTDLVAPEPDQNLFGEATDPASLQWLLEDASELLEGQDTLFQTDTKIKPGSVVKYYHDETILVITWRQKIGKVVYTLSEVKIADPSQFRRFLSDGEYASGSKYLTTEMAESVNAVLACNGDYYAMRQMGTIVYNSQMMRMEGYRMDTCFIDGNGDMQFIEYGEITDKAEMEQYLADHNVRFSLAFGPILIENGELCPIKDPYPVGEVDIPNARAALCQLDTLHYLVVVSSQPPYGDGQTLGHFARDLASFGCKMAYNLDGGRSATLVMNDQLINEVSERRVSDIIYFATAIPNGDK